MDAPIWLVNLTIWLAAISTILLVTSEILTPQHARTSMFIHKRRFRNVTFVISIIFLISAVVNILVLFLP